MNKETQSSAEGNKLIDSAEAAILPEKVGQFQSNQSGRFFFYGVALVLFITGLAKMISSTGTAKILDYTDPILTLPMRPMLVIVGAVEVLVGCLMLFRINPRIKVLLTLWLAASFITYRAGMVWLGYNHYCPCLGTVASSLHLPELWVQRALTIAVLYLLFGGILIAWKFARSSKKILAARQASPESLGVFSNGIIAVPVYLFALNAIGMEPSHAFSIVEQLKRHLESPPAVEELEWIEHHPGGANPKFGVTEDYYCYGLWQTNGFLTRQVPMSNPADVPATANNGYFNSMFTNGAWILMQNNKATNLTYWSPPVPIVGSNSFRKQMNELKVLTPYLLGIQFLVPGTVQWNGLEFTGQASVIRLTGNVSETMKGRLILDSSGMPAEIQYQVSGAPTNTGYITQLKYENNVGLSYFPSRITLHFKQPREMQVKPVIWDIKRVALATRSLGPEDFDPGKFYKTNPFTVAIISNQTTKVLSMKGIWREPLKERPRPQSHNWTLRFILIGLGFLTLIILLRLRGRESGSSVGR